MKAATTPEIRRAILRQSWSIALAVVPFGLAFGLACADAGLSVGEAMGFSMLMFTGGSQFAAVKVIGDGGSAWAAIAAAVLLGLRSLAYGVVMAPSLTGPRWWRALASHWMIDETMAVGSVQADQRDRRYGYLAMGLAMYVCWNLSTLIGVAVVSNLGDLVTTWGLDATIPASFLALVWPRLADPAQRMVAIGGSAIALGLIPIAPSGMPIIAAGAAVLLARRTINSTSTPTPRASGSAAAPATAVPDGDAGLP